VAHTSSHSSYLLYINAAKVIISDEPCNSLKQISSLLGRGVKEVKGVKEVNDVSE
jgi:hypothetical protein